MAIFTVHEPPRRQGDLAAHADGFVFLRDRFSWPAFLVPSLWMLRHRLWLALAGYVLAGAGLVLVLRFAGLPTGAAALVVLLLSLLIGIEAGNLRRLALARRGYAQLGVVVADDLESAERRRLPASMPISSESSSTMRAAAPAGSAIKRRARTSPAPAST